ncbi:MAG: HAD family phosphatase [Oscillospiraceae bacterium]|nr:HAD family phosphatase [Oscillospiraceae bacterium]
MKTRLAIFDLDGTLFDTKEVNFRAYCAAFARCGCAVDAERFRENFFGRHFTEFLPLFVENPTPALIHDIHEAKKACYSEFLCAARENAALFDYIEAARPGCKTAIVTTASRKNVEDILQYFGRAALFDLLVTQEDVKKVKPDPEGFLLAMARFGVSPCEAVIFEDSESGIRCARSTGASVLRVEQF